MMKTEMCEAVGSKKCYTREEAAAAMREEQHSGNSKYLRIYCCEHCQHWHLTHKKFVRKYNPF